MKIFSAAGIRLPYFSVGLKDAPVRVLVTAGLDGDEYAGIEAAYRLEKELAASHFSSVGVTVVPLVNRPGFLAGTSFHPLDGKYPKNIYPGNPSGTDSERLVAVLIRQFVSSATVWLDLHGGAITEKLQPFILASETGKSGIDQLVTQILKSLPGRPVIVYLKRGALRRPLAIARRGSAYLILESGWGGKPRLTDINRHLRWVRTIIGNLDRHQALHSVRAVYRRLDVVSARQDCFWFAECGVGQNLVKGEIVGKTADLTSRQVKKVLCPRTGVSLWLRSASGASGGDTLCVIMSEKASL
jgi:hypothetical protein